jgi:predicted Ser/Thr protein kinase
VSEIGDMFSSYADASKKKRASNRADSARMLEGAGIKFSEHNGGAHLVVCSKSCVFDFWPGTGKWVKRPTKNYQRGVAKLIKEVLKEES